MGFTYSRTIDLRHDRLELTIPGGSVIQGMRDHGPAGVVIDFHTPVLTTLVTRVLRIRGTFAFGRGEEFVGVRKFSDCARYVFDAGEE